MKPVDQTLFHGEPGQIGNCMQAAVASLLELDLDDVPHFAAIEHGWWEAFLEFCAARGFAVVICDPAPSSELLGLAGGPSPRGVLHMVVARGDEVVHDPHPSRAGLEAIRETWYLVPFDPAAARG